MAFDKRCCCIIISVIAALAIIIFILLIYKYISASKNLKGGIQTTGYEFVKSYDVKNHEDTEYKSYSTYINEKSKDYISDSIDALTDVLIGYESKLLYTDKKHNYFDLCYVNEMFKNRMKRLGKSDATILFKLEQYKKFREAVFNTDIQEIKFEDKIDTLLHIIPALVDFLFLSKFYFNSEELTIALGSSNCVFKGDNDDFILRILMFKVHEKKRYEENYNTIYNVLFNPDLFNDLQKYIPNILDKRTLQYTSRLTEVKTIWLIVEKIPLLTSMNGDEQSNIKKPEALTQLVTFMTNLINYLGTKGLRYDDWKLANIGMRKKTSEKYDFVVVDFDFVSKSKFSKTLPDDNIKEIQKGATAVGINLSNELVIILEFIMVQICKTSYEGIANILKSFKDTNKSTTPSYDLELTDLPNLITFIPNEKKTETENRDDDAIIAGFTFTETELENRKKEFLGKIATTVDVSAELKLDIGYLKDIFNKNNMKGYKSFVTFVKSDKEEDSQYVYIYGATIKREEVSNNVEEFEQPSEPDYKGYIKLDINAMTVADRSTVDEVNKPIFDADAIEENVKILGNNLFILSDSDNITGLINGIKGYI